MQAELTQEIYKENVNPGTQNIRIIQEPTAYTVPYIKAGKGSYGNLVQLPTYNWNLSF